MNISSRLPLSSGTTIPALGLGTWKSAPGEAGAAVKHALTRTGYSHIDCAAIYKNQAEIGEALTRVFDSGARRREDVFITSKLWNTHHKAGKVRAACETSLTDLGLSYLDLYLMHWGVATLPADTRPEASINESLAQRLDDQGRVVVEYVSIAETWAAMEELVHAGLVRAIGVANFTAPMLANLLATATIRPAVNQIETHPYLQQTALIDFCTREGITVTAYSPLGSPQSQVDPDAPVLLTDPTIQAIAEAHSATPAQVLIRYTLERGLSVIPKSVSLERITGNADVFNWSLTNDERIQIDALERGMRVVDPSNLWKFPYFA